SGVRFVGSLSHSSSRSWEPPQPDWRNGAREMTIGAANAKPWNRNESQVPRRLRIDSFFFFNQACTMLTILRDAGLSRLIESEAIEKLAGGFQFTEGPLWCPDGSLLFQDIKAERTYRLGPGSQLDTLREHTGAA